MKKSLFAFVLVATMVPAASYAQVIVNVAPPRVVVEHRGPRPGADYVWIGGYQRWDGGHYVWTPGRWERPPHPGAHWEAHRWEHRDGHYVFHEGHWR